ncbi:MAG: UbiD family decarboxylase [Gammaproteobacteria bacterium]|nr:UbiD family decarboxylase [Gammaproteobacteria bacterium]
MGDPIRSLRDWLTHLEQTGRVARSRPGIPLKFTLAALAKRLDGIKATVFPEPGGHAVSIVSGLVSDRQWIAEVLGVDASEVVNAYRRAAEHPLPWKEVPSADAPVQEHISRDVDLNRDLPIPIHNEHDSGAYITAGLVIAANPATGHQNVSINRLQVSGKNRLGVLILPRDLHRFYDLAEAKGDGLPVAIAIGVDPLTLLASQAILPIDHDELMVAGALHGAPLAVVKCVTNDVRVRKRPTKVAH